MSKPEMKVEDLEEQPESFRAELGLKFSEDGLTYATSPKLANEFETADRIDQPSAYDKPEKSGLSRFSLVKFNSPEETSNTSVKRNKKKKSIMEEFYISEPENSDEVTFKMEVFLEIFFYHFVFYFLIGPFIVILKIFPRVKMQVLRNMQFVGMECMFQTLQWAFFITAVALYAILNVKEGGTKNIYLAEFYDLFLINIVRISYISCKYAYSTPKFLKIFREKAIATKEIEHQFLMIYFLKGQNSETVHEQLQESFLRLKVDTSIFYFTFLGHDPNNFHQERFNKKRALEKLARKATQKDVKGKRKILRG